MLTLAALLAGVADAPQVQGALRGMGAVAAGLIAGTGLKLVAALKRNVMGWIMCGSLIAATFVAIAWLRWPLAWVLLGLGALACLWAYRRQGAAASGGSDE